ncbi:MAG: hypothetical protein IPK88_04275 [Saprospiraceae bacterium]|nr:hypothetical protein [Candidatus Defluviibacterium haderslevense]
MKKIIICLQLLTVYNTTLVYGQIDLSTRKECSLLGLNLGDLESLIIEKEEFSSSHTYDDGTVIREVSHNLSKEQDLLDYFNLEVNIKWYDDRKAPNALATNRITNSSKNDGTILLGLELSEQTEQDVFDYIIYHEAAHIFDFKNNLDLSGKERELFADFVAGFMLGWLHSRENHYSQMMTKFEPNKDWSLDLKRREDHIVRVFRKFYNIGDYNFNSPSHHGTPSERLNIVKKGYRLGFNEGTTMNKEEWNAYKKVAKKVNKPYENWENASKYLSLSENDKGGLYTKPNLHNIYEKFKTF